MVERDIRDLPRTDPTDDARARHAVQNPLEAAASPQPTPPRSGALGWAIPVAAVLVVLIALFAFVL